VAVKLACKYKDFIVIAGIKSAADFAHKEGFFWLNNFIIQEQKKIQVRLANTLIYGKSDYDPCKSKIVTVHLRQNCIMNPT